MNLLLINVLGVIAILITTVISLPQLLIVIRSKDGEGIEDISLLSVLFLCIADLLWIIVDALLHLWIFVGGGAGGFIITMILLVKLIQYRRLKCSQVSSTVVDETCSSTKTLRTALDAHCEK